MYITGSVTYAIFISIFLSYFSFRSWFLLTFKTSTSTHNEEPSFPLPKENSFKKNIAYCRLFSWWSVFCVYVKMCCVLPCFSTENGCQYIVWRNKNENWIWVWKNGKLFGKRKKIWFYDYMWKQVMWTDGYKLLWLLLFSVISFLSLECFSKLICRAV